MIRKASWGDVQVEEASKTKVYVYMHARTRHACHNRQPAPADSASTTEVDSVADLRVTQLRHAEFGYIRTNSDSNAHACYGSRTGTRLSSSSHDGTWTVPATVLVVRRRPMVAFGQFAAFTSSTRRFLYLAMNQAKSSFNIFINIL
jgi:hypothetical protein